MQHQLADGLALAQPVTECDGCSIGHAEREPHADADGLAHGDGDRGGLQVVVLAA